MCFFRFFNALSCAGKHATSVMFYKVKMTKKADFWPNATCFFFFYVLGLFLYVRIEERKKEEWSKQ